MAIKTAPFKVTTTGLVDTNQTWEYDTGTPEGAEIDLDFKLRDAITAASQYYWLSKDGQSRSMATKSEDEQQMLMVEFSVISIEEWRNKNQ